MERNLYSSIYDSLFEASLVLDFPSVLVERFGPPVLTFVDGNGKLNAMTVEARGQTWVVGLHRVVVDGFEKELRPLIGECVPEWAARCIVLVVGESEAAEVACFLARMARAFDDPSVLRLQSSPACLDLTPDSLVQAQALYVTSSARGRRHVGRDCPGLVSAIEEAEIQLRKRSAG